MPLRGGPRRVDDAGMDKDLFANDLSSGAPAGGETEASPARGGFRAGTIVAGAVVVLAAWGVVAMVMNADTVSDVPSGVSDISSSYDSDSYGSDSYGSSSSGSSSSGSSSPLPLGPIGAASCRSAVADAKSYVPDAIRDAQSGVDDLIAENPELAAYAAEAKRMLAESAPDVYQSLDDAGDQLGC